MEQPLTLSLPVFLGNRACRTAFPSSSPRVTGPLTGLTVSVCEPAFHADRKDKTCAKKYFEGIFGFSWQDIFSDPATRYLHNLSAGSGTTCVHVI